jgi:hypothetical protein
MTEWQACMAKRTHSVESVLDSLKDHGSKQTREAMARYNIPSDRAFGVPMRENWGTVAVGYDESLC